MPIDTSASSGSPAPPTRSAGTHRSLRYRLARGVVAAVLAAAVGLGIATGVYELTQDSSDSTAVSVATAYPDMAFDSPVERLRLS